MIVAWFVFIVIIGYLLGYFVNSLFNGAKNVMLEKSAFIYISCLMLVFIGMALATNFKFVINSTCIIILSVVMVLSSSRFIIDIVKERSSLDKWYFRYLMIISIAMIISGLYSILAEGVFKLV